MGERRGGVLGGVRGGVVGGDWSRCGSVGCRVRVGASGDCGGCSGGGGGGGTGERGVSRGAVGNGFATNFPL